MARGPVAVVPGRRVDPGEQRPEVLVLQRGLAGGPVPGQQLRHGDQQRGARHPGPLAEVGEPAAQQRHLLRRRVRALRVLLGGAAEAVGPPQQPHQLDPGPPRHDELRSVGAQLGDDLDALARLRVGLGALGGLHLGRVLLDVRQDHRGEAGEEGEAQLPVGGLRDHQQPGRVPVGADERAERSPGLTGRGERDEDQRAGGEVAVEHGRGGLRPARTHRLQPGEGADQRHPGPRSDAPAPAVASASVRSRAARRSASTVASVPGSVAPSELSGDAAAVRTSSTEVSPPSSPRTERPSAVTSPAARARSRQWKASSQAERHSGA